MQVEALVSICITSYNYGRYLRDAIESALAQTYPHIEVVISDNASTDSTREVLAEYKNHSRVRVFINERNVGLCKNHNLAIERACGEYIVVLSADDIIFPEHVDRLMQRMHDPLDPVLIVSGQGMELNEHLDPIGPLLTLGNLPVSYSRRDEFGSLLFNYHHVYPAKLVSRGVYEQVGLFDERIVTSIDVEFCARVDEFNIPSAFIPVFVCGLRSHGTRSSVRSTQLTNELLNDKLCTIERALDPKNAWRTEGFEASILAIVDLELQRLTSIDADPLDDFQSARLERVRSIFSDREQQTPEWPTSEPQLSVVLVSEGYLQLLRYTLETIFTQQVDRLEVIIVQASGYDVRPWIARLPYGDRIRVVQVRACATPAQAFRYGLDLARGEFVTYLSEGQRIGAELYAAAILYARSTDGQMMVLPKERIDDYFPLLMTREQRYHQFVDPASRARMRAEAGPYALCQLIHRRGILRASTIFIPNFYEGMIAHEESTFVEMLASQYRTVMFAAA